MSTIDATISMLDSMPEEARMKVFIFTQNLFTSIKPASPFVPLTEDKVISDLSISRQQAANGEGMNMRDALLKMGREHGFILKSSVVMSGEEGNDSGYFSSAFR